MKLEKESESDGKDVLPFSGLTIIIQLRAWPSLGLTSLMASATVVVLSTDTFLVTSLSPGCSHTTSILTIALASSALLLTFRFLMSKCSLDGILNSLEFEACLEGNSKSSIC
jgi:hypothetical protein